MASGKKPRKRSSKYVKANGSRNNGGTSSVFRRVFAIIMVLGTLFGLCWGTMSCLHWLERKLFSQNSTFEIQNLDVSSDGSLTEDRILEYSKLRKGMNLFSFDFETIEERLDQVSAIESVYLERQLPHTLIIRVKERVPIARIAGKKVPKFPFVVDRFGYILPPKAKAFQLPLITGVDMELRLGDQVHHADVETALQIVKYCAAEPFFQRYIRLKSLDVKYSEYITLTLEDEVQVKIPRYELKERLRNLATVIKMETAGGNRVKGIDLTLDTPNVPVQYY